MNNRVVYFTEEWEISMSSNKFNQASNCFPPEFKDMIYREYEKLRWSKGKVGGGITNRDDKFFNEVFSKENIQDFEQLIYINLLIELHKPLLVDRFENKFESLPSSGCTIQTDEINPILIPSPENRFGDWKLILKFTSKQYTLLNKDFTDDRGSTYYDALFGNIHAGGLQEGNNETRRLMVSRHIHTHIVTLPEI